MSFQGDVRGIGLAELLQGLARGRKEGVLTLTSRGDHRSVLGMEDGKAWLLPDPEEDHEVWRTRARSAWADDPNFTIEPAKLEPIVKAARLETLYALLDGGGVHFRFDPGEVPERVTKLEEQGFPHTEIHCQPAPVEFLLLEYARIADEIELAGHPQMIPPDVIPCVADADELSSLQPTLVQAIDGNSTVQEISDRLGWPVRQAQLSVLSGINAGGLRFAHPIEVLRLAQHELQRKQFARAASRLSLWCRIGTPGPLVAEDAEALSNEWLAGRLTAAMRLMAMRNVRCLLRRLDATLNSSSHAVVHWTEANRIKASDRISRLRLMACTLRDGGEGCGLEVREVLDLARELREHDSPMRSGPALAIAAFLQPDSIPQRLELGMGLLQAARSEEAGPWIVSACTDMLAQGHADRILGPLRALIEADPRNREGRELLTQAKRQSTRSKKLRRNVAISASVAVMLGAGAIVKIKMDEKRTDRIASIRSMVTKPRAALAQLSTHFADDTSMEIGDLRSELEERLRKDELKQRNEWLGIFHGAQKEAAEGDILTALEMTREIPPPPRLELVTESWPSRMDILMAMPKRLTDEIHSLGRPNIHKPHQAQLEAAIRERAEELRASLNDIEQNAADFQEFRDAIDEVTELVVRRGEERSTVALQLEREEILSENDRLLDLAHGALERHEYERALRHYDEILENDPSGKVHRVLRDEIELARVKRDAVEQARKSAARGDHAAALEVLTESFDEGVKVMLPFQVVTTPPGATVTITREGDTEGIEKTTPFTLEGTFSDLWTMKVHLDDFDERTLKVDGPQDIALDLSRTPDLHFTTDGRVDAIPMPIGDGTTGDYIVADRNGAIARIAWNGSTRWRQEIKTVSGFARRPVPLQGRGGQLLFLTETGTVWLIDPKDGNPEGPWQPSDPPVFGPVAVGQEVHAQLRSGRLARWSSSLRPRFEEAGVSAPLDESLRYGFEGLFQTIRPNGSDGQELRAPTAGGSGWTVRPEESRYLVFEDGREDEPFTIQKDGDWRYLGWEAPSKKGELPILWISDGMGLRAFLPPGVDRELTPLHGIDLAGPPVPDVLFGPADESKDDASEEPKIGPMPPPAGPPEGPNVEPDKKPESGSKDGE